MNTPYDSRPDTEAHIARVNSLLLECQETLRNRGILHDVSKLHDPEKACFDQCTATLKSMPYGSPEYVAALAELKPALDHHYANNSHHPEHFPHSAPTETTRMLRASAMEMQATCIEAEGEAAASEINSLRAFAQFTLDTADQLESRVNGMTLFDVIEMLMDWKAATERMKDGGDIYASLEINQKRFAINPQLASILFNTAKAMGWQEKGAAK
jgi:hypothetical protein